MSDDTQVEVLLQFEGSNLYEVKGGKPTLLMESCEVILVSLVPTAAQVAAATAQLGLPEGSLVVGDGTPLVFIFAGEYKIPVNRTVLVLQSGAHDFTFVLPNQLFLQLILPSTSDADELEAFEHVMFSYGNLKKKPSTATTVQQRSSAQVATAPPATLPTPTAGPTKISSRIAIGLGKVTRVAVAGITKGAEIVAHGVTKGTDKIVEVTEPCREAVKVSEQTKSHINKARAATKGVAVLSGTVATAMIGVTAVLGNFIGTRVASRVAKSDEDGSGMIDKFAGVKEVGGAAIGCVGLIFDAATDAGKTILTSSCDGISKVVTHKLGEEAGAVTANGLGVVTDVVDIQSNVKKAGVRGIMRATAQTSALAMVDELERKQQPQLQN